MSVPLTQHHWPELRVLTGENALTRLGEELKRVGAERAVIVCGRSIADSELRGRVEVAMLDRYAGTVARVQPHSPTGAVLETATELRDRRADAVVAVGGGSAIVTGRAAAIVLAEGEDITAHSTRIDDDGRIRSPRLLKPKLPQLVVPTTPNTAAVKAGAAVYDHETASRKALFDPTTRACSVLIDPDMLASAPRSLVIAASLDCLTMAVEGLLSPSSNPLTDAHLMHAIRLIHQRLARIATNDDSALRVDLSLGAVLCGRGTDHAGAGAATVIGHALGPRHGVDNGIVKAIVLEHVLRFNADFAPRGIANVAAALGNAERPLTQVIDTLQRLFASLQVPTGLHEIGIPGHDLPQAAELCMGDWFLRGNPREVSSADDLLRILDAAF